MSLIGKIIRGELEPLTDRRGFIREGSTDIASLLLIFLGTRRSCNCSSTVNNKNIPDQLQVIKGLTVLEDLANSESYSYDQFLIKIKERMENEGISAFIFGEQHSINEHKDLAHKTMVAINSTSKDIIKFFDEAIQWSEPIGVFAQPYGKSND